MSAPTVVRGGDVDGFRLLAVYREIWRSLRSSCSGPLGEEDKWDLTEARGRDGRLRLDASELVEPPAFRTPDAERVRALGRVRRAQQEREACRRAKPPRCASQARRP
jgi:hypothetical protein